ncbi:MAG: hypothetical protein HYX67_04230 [Candidatus Melainabacteria bacterium]|nr:hypothetical protein [Candidatus Melainabacteria bacterium]
MDLRITQLHHSVQIYRDAPFRDGIANLRAAFDPKSRITCDHSDSISGRLTEYSNRAFQAGVGLVLLIPVVKIVIDFGLRWWSGTNAVGVWQPSNNVIPLQEMDMKMRYSVLPRTLDFLQANGFEQASLHFAHPVHPAPYEIKVDLGQGNGIVNLQMPADSRLSEKEVFAELKTKIIFRIKNLNEANYTQQFNFNDPEDFPQYNVFVEADVKPKVLRLMRDLGYTDVRFGGGLNPSTHDNAVTGTALFSLNLNISVENRQLVKFDREVIWSSRANNVCHLRSEPLMKEIIREIALNTQFLPASQRAVNSFSFTAV